MPIRSVLFLIQSTPYGSEKAFGALNAAAVCLPCGAAVGLFGDGVYLALAGQDASALRVPTLSDIIYAYPEMRVFADEASLSARGLMGQSLVERVELMDPECFLKAVMSYESVLVF